MRKLFKKLVPKGVLRFLLRKKYQPLYTAIHIQNILKGNVAYPICSDPAQASLLSKYLDETFAGTIMVEGKQVYLKEAAILKVPSKYEQYLESVGPKTRNMIRKAERAGIIYNEFEWNDRLSEIYEINTSSDSRQGHRMAASYRKYPDQVNSLEKSAYGIHHIGGFIREKLVAYVELYVLGNFAFVNRILGHRQHLTTGLMNGLIAACVQYALKSKIDYINYLTMENLEENTLSSFKYRVGFRPCSVFAVAKMSSFMHGASMEKISNSSIG